MQAPEIGSSSQAAALRSSVDWTTATAPLGAARAADERHGLLLVLHRSERGADGQGPRRAGVNGNFWFFFGALSNVEYTITVTDTASGAVHAYHNPARHVRIGRRHRSVPRRE